jgi:hypothetical protein
MTRREATATVINARADVLDSIRSEDSINCLLHKTLLMFYMTHDTDIALSSSSLRKKRGYSPKGKPATSSLLAAENNPSGLWCLCLTVGYNRTEKLNRILSKLIIPSASNSSLSIVEVTRQVRKSVRKWHCRLSFY